MWSIIHLSYNYDFLLIISSSLTQMDGHESRVFALKYHPTDPNILVSAGWDDTVQFWDKRVENSIRYCMKCMCISVVAVKIFYASVSAFKFSKPLWFLYFCYFVWLYTCHVLCVVSSVLAR